MADAAKAVRVVDETGGDAPKPINVRTIEKVGFIEPIEVLGQARGSLSVKRQSGIAGMDIPGLKLDFAAGIPGVLVRCTPRTGPASVFVPMANVRQIELAE